MLQPKLGIFRASSGGSRWSAAFHNSSSEDKLGAHAAVAEASYGHVRSEHVHHSLLYSSFVRRGVRRRWMLSPGAECGSRQAVRALDLDLVCLS